MRQVHRVLNENRQARASRMPTRLEMRWWIPASSVKAASTPMLMARPLRLTTWNFQKRVHLELPLLSPKVHRSFQVKLFNIEASMAIAEEG